MSSTPRKESRAMSSQTKNNHSKKKHRMLCWFSCGAASACMSKLAVTHYSDQYDVQLVYCDTSADEHPDNLRFLRNVEAWVGQSVIRLMSKKYQRINDVFRGVRYINGPAGAPCTRILKRQVRESYQRPDDVHCLGYTTEEQHRIDRFEKNYPELDTEFVLVKAKMSKGDCHLMLDAAGIDQPAMYLLGYKNNNCIGCVKGGQGYWNKIRIDFPERFEEMALLEKELGATVLRGKHPRVNGQRGESYSIPLFELSPEMGRHDGPDIGDCGVFCDARGRELLELIQPPDGPQEGKP